LELREVEKLQHKATLQRRPLITRTQAGLQKQFLEISFMLIGLSIADKLLCNDMSITVK
jgi:hypothetical protein